jgi:hypothetical protein
MALVLTTAETGYGYPTMEGVVEWLWSNPPEPGKPRGDHPRGHSREVVAHAIVRQSRWVVLCPWCPSAQYAHTTDRRFFCVDCGNVALEGKWISVEWPAEPEAIEQQLAVRPEPGTRNWEWGEALADLMYENAQHGVSKLELP